MAYLGRDGDLEKIGFTTRRVDKLVLWCLSLPEENAKSASDALYAE